MTRRASLPDHYLPNRPGRGRPLGIVSLLRDRDRFAVAIVAALRFVPGCPVEQRTRSRIVCFLLDPDPRARMEILRVGITADAGSGEVKGLGDQLYRLGQEVALPTDKVTAGLEVLVAQGRSLKEAMAFLPAVARTAAASGAEVDDIAKSADSVGSNFKIAAQDMQSAFDIMSAGGKAGQFELKEMARYLPSLGPAAAAVGFKGTEGLADIVSILQVLRKGAGTSEEAAASASNIFQKINSEETRKRFKKMGVDLEAGLKKGAKEGKNIITVFEELVQTATKGDLSKIPQLINDMEFSRGIRALMSYRNEWQKLSKTIQTTSRGSVEIDLTRVTNDARAKLDKLADIVRHRARQIGGIVANIAIPINDKIEEVTSGKNATVNRVEEWAKHYNADVVANEEIRTGEKRDYDPDVRRLIDARKELVMRNRIEAERGRLDGELKRLQDERQAAIDQGEKDKMHRGFSPRIRDAIDRRTDSQVKPLDDRIAAAKEGAGSFAGLARRIDEIQLLLAEGSKPLSDAKGSRIPNAPSAPRFDRTTPATMLFGINGPVGSDPEWMPPALGKPMKHPLPPSRPDSLPKAPVTADDLKGLFPAMPDWASLTAKIVEPVTATVEGPVTAELKGNITARIQIEVKGPGQITGMSATSSTPVISPITSANLGRSMPQAGNNGPDY